MVDQNKNRLNEALDNIEKFRHGSSEGKKAVRWGDIITFQSTELKQSIANSWMVVEVRFEPLFFFWPAFPFVRLEMSIGLT